MKQRHVYSIKVMYKKWQYVIVGATFLALLVFSMNVGIAADWPRWRGPKGDGISTETDLDPTALLKGLQILWKATVGLGYSNVVIKDNHLYTMGILDRKTTVFCLSAETGKEIWRRVTESFGEPQSTPTIDEEFVYVLTRDGLLLCLKAKNGKVRWKLNIVDEYKVMCPWYGFAGSPVVEGDFLIITVNSWGIALDKKTGSLIWMSPPVDYKKEVSTSTGSLYATPVIYSQNDKRHAFILSGYGLYSVEVDTGKPNWFYKWNPSDKIADPILFDNKVFISTAEDFVGCVLLDISGKKPKALWENKNLLNDVSTSVLIDGYLYGCHGSVRYEDSVLRCAHFETGKIMWEKDLGQRRSMCLSAAGNKLIILDNRGMLRIAQASPNKYEEISTAQLFGGQVLIKCCTSPVLCGSRIYCRNYPGDLWCIDVRK